VLLCLLSGVRGQDNSAQTEINVNFANMLVGVPSSELGADMASSRTYCQFVSYSTLQSNLQSIVNQGNNGGTGTNVFATVVSKDGCVCEITFSGSSVADQRLSARALSAQRASTASSWCTSSFAYSTANLYQNAQPGRENFGFEDANPVDPWVAYRGDPDYYGSAYDPAQGGKIGGFSGTGGGLCLYDSAGNVLGGLGVAGDTSCADHVIAWHLRHALLMDYVVGGVNPDTTRPDNVIFSASPATDSSGFAHPVCTQGALNSLTSANSLVGALEQVRSRPS